jgi:DNA modification methylase
MTSPPFPLVQKKKYGNVTADKYVDWFSKFVPEFSRVLKTNGSLVIHAGGTWNEGIPTKSLCNFKLLLALSKEFHVAQEFYWYNPAKLPSPAEWVTVRRIRAKDAVDPVWWLSKTPFPKASNRRVLRPYTQSMEKLLMNGYKPGLRPSGHNVTAKFSKRNRGAIPPNLLILSNTDSRDPYLIYCKKKGISPNPARYPSELPAFFIRFLTTKSDIVLDPFGGSNTTGWTAERLGRRWISIEKDRQYLEASRSRFVGSMN